MKITQSQVEQILEKAIWSPSGDNCQPWTFEWDGQLLSVFHDPVRAEHPINTKGLASVITLGCLIEMIRIAATEFHFIPEFTFHEFISDKSALWLQLNFVSANIEKEPLLESLTKRCTNRNFYKGGNLSANMFNKLENKEARLHLIERPSAELVNYIVESEQLLVQWAEILPATMKWTRFSVNHAKKTKDGLSWRNLGAKIWEVPMMPLLRDFPWLMKIMKFAVGPQHKIRVRKQLLSSAGIICVSTPLSMSSYSPLNVVDSGQLLMNGWLSMTRISYGVQPLTLASTICLASRLGKVALPNNWKEFFEKGEKLLRREFSIPKDSMPVWMVRTGIAEPLPENAKTFRKPLQDVLTIKTAT